MKVPYCIFLAVVLNNIVLPASLFAQGFVCDGRFFISLAAAQGSVESPDTDVFKIDFSQDDINFADNVVFSGIEFNGIGYNRKDNFIYGIRGTRNAQNKLPIVRLFPDGSYEVLPLGEGEINDVTWQFVAGDCSPDGYFVVYDQTSQQLHYLDVSGEEVTLHASLPLRWAPEIGIDDFYVAMDDFAFDVSGDGTLYSYQRNYDFIPKESEQTRGALLKINGDLNSPNAGTVLTVGQLDPDIVVNMGALFFNTAGQLYGYASSTPFYPIPPGLTHNRLIAIDKATAETQLVEVGPVATSNDGCSCPFTLGMQMQAISPPDACQGVIDYEVTISNSSANSVSGITFTDTLPGGMTVVDLSSLEDVVHEIADDTGVGFEIVTLENMSLPPGSDISFTISVSSRGLSGTFGHQAYLTNVPVALGTVLVSDDTTTTEPYDPTVVTITEEIPQLELNRDTLICEGEPIVLSAVVDPTWSYYWTNDDGFYSEETSPRVTIPEGRDSTYYFVHQKKGDCELIDSLLIRTTPAPTLELAADTTITLGTAIPLAPSLIADAEVTYQWSPAEGLSCTDCANPQASPTTTTEYTLVVSNPLGCTVSGSITVEVIEQEPEPEPETGEGVLIPNAFSPNDDRLNDVFFPVASANTTCHLLEIYNRWGELVFRQTDFAPNDATHGWDGTYRGQMASTGTYTYRLVTTRDADQQKEYQGTLHLIK